MPLTNTFPMQPLNRVELLSTTRRLAKTQLSSKIGIPCLALASLLGAAPCLAAVQPSDQFVTHQSEPVMVANLGNLNRDVNRAAQDVERQLQRQQRDRERQEREATRARERQQQEAARERQRQEQEAARQAAAEQRRLAAERERQYFESLSPEQQQAYLTEKRAREAAQIEAAASVLMFLFSSGDGGSAPESSNPDYIYVPDNTYRPTPQPAAPSTAPISPFYCGTHW